MDRVKNPRRVGDVLDALTPQQKRRILAWPVDGWFTTLPSSERREFRYLICRDGPYGNRFTSFGLNVRASLSRQKEETMGDGA